MLPPAAFRQAFGWCVDSKFTRFAAGSFGNNQSLHAPQMFENMGVMRSGIASRIALLCVCMLQGGYMLFDGIHKLRTGSYFGSHLGPWANLVSAVGISPGVLAPVFIALGALWLTGAIAFLLNLRWSSLLLRVLSIISLAYLVFGTVLSVAGLALLHAQTHREYGSQRVRS